MRWKPFYGCVNHSLVLPISFILLILRVWCSPAVTAFLPIWYLYLWYKDPSKILILCSIEREPLIFLDNFHGQEIHLAEKALHGQFSHGYYSWLKSINLKVVGNEKWGRSGGWLQFEDAFRPWRSMSVYFLMLPLIGEVHRTFSWCEYWRTNVPLRQ